MALYTIGDLHLSFEADKSMEAFGGRWIGYVNKLKEGFSTVKPDDVTVLCGDLSWGMNLEQSREDFRFIDALPGKKIIVKGNHDYWWTTAAKIRNFFLENGFNSLDILHNNCLFYGDTALCGTRGWFYEAETGGEHDKKIMLREILRLETSLKAAGDAEKIVFLHYPPKYGSYVCEEILSLLEQYRVQRCYYGHLHGAASGAAYQGTFNGTRFSLVSADYLYFIPKKVLS